MRGHECRQEGARLRLELLDAVRQFSCGSTEHALITERRKQGVTCATGPSDGRRAALSRRTVPVDLHSVDLIAGDLEGPSNGRHRMLPQAAVQQEGKDSGGADMS